MTPRLNPSRWPARAGAAVLGALAVLLALPFAVPLDDSGVEPQALGTANSRWQAVNGVRLHYQVDGAPDGAPVLLIHGVFGSTETWRHTVPALVEAGYRVIRYDRIGFGLSDKPEHADYGALAQADAAVALLSALGVERAAVVGHSAGGNIAAHLALRHPQRVERLVLVSAALVGGPPPFVGRLVAFPPIWRWGRIGLRAYFTPERVEQTIRGFYAEASVWSPADRDLYWRAFQTPSWEVGLLAATRDGAIRPLGEAELRRIAAPIVLIWGERDRVTPLAHAERARAWRPDARLIVIPEVGHQPFEEAPTAFNAELVRALSDP